MIIWCKLKFAWKHYPMTSQLVSAGLLAISGDLLSQRVEGQPRVDTKRMKHFFFSRVCVANCSYVSFQYCLETVLRKPTPLKKILIDTFLYTPFAICLFYMTMAILEKQGFYGGVKRIQNTFVQTLFVAWTFWPAVNIVTYWVLPFQWRLLFTTIAEFYWGFALSYINHKHSAEGEENPSLYKS